jgi:acyl-CoA thioesterase
MRRHAGIGTSMAHDTVSTGVMGISITFHEPVRWEGWLLYHHESTQVGRGMSYVRGQVFTEKAQLIASFTQDAMIRAFVADSPDTARPVSARL